MNFNLVNQNQTCDGKKKNTKQNKEAGYPTEKKHARYQLILLYYNIRSETQASHWFKCNRGCPVCWFNFTTQHPFR